MADEKTVLYRCPGNHPAAGGITYDWVPASSQANVDQLVQDGWSLTLGDAIDLYRLNTGAEPDPATATGTPAEQADAAKAARDAAAEKALAANKALEADTAAAAAAEKEYDAAAADCQKDEEALAVLTDRVKSSRAHKVAAADRSAVANRTLNSSKLRAATAKRILIAAVNKVLTADSAVNAAAQKAMDEAKAADAALAAAAAKGPTI